MILSIRRVKSVRGRNTACCLCGCILFSYPALDCYVIDDVGEKPHHRYLHIQCALDVNEFDVEEIDNPDINRLKGQATILLGEVSKPLSFN